MLKKLEQAKNIFFIIYTALASLALLILIVATFVQVVGRYVFNSSPSWTEEVARFAFVWFSCLGAAVALDKGLHAAITVVVDKLPKPLKLIANLAMAAVVMAISILMIVYGYSLAAASTTLPSAALRLPMNYINISVCFCGVGMAIATVFSIINILLPKKEEGSAEV